ncbi:MAG: N-acetyltransferase [Woeseiaceae bacterium]|nr:N-acetyltransferase [Woeseiaceae bacterium]
MPVAPEIRISNARDIDAIVSMYPLAFPDEDLVPVVRQLLAEPELALSLVAIVDDQVVGHVIFTTCAVEGSDLRSSLLAPLAVAPGFQRQGIGSEIVKAGLQRLIDSGVEVAFVLGDPAYYSRFGFVPDSKVQPPYPLPAEWYTAWQSQYLGDASRSYAGKLAVPSQWLDPALWAP